MTLTAQVPRRLARATVKIRKSATKLKPDELGAFREALAGMMARRDNHGYQYYAGWHGVPDDLCEHHNDLFLPWHRGYLHHFELGLQERDPNVTLPWWDWVDEAGLPEPYAKQRVGNKRNVLFDAPIEPMRVAPQRGWPKRTFRRSPSGPPPLPVPPPLRSHYKWLMEPKSYTEFNRRLWILHDNLHGWIGGTMNDPLWAAFDPLFWAHHTMVDRLWRIWQHNNKGALPPQALLDRPMTYAKAPSLTVREVIETRPLGYEYALVTATSPGTR